MCLSQHLQNGIKDAYNLYIVQKATRVVVIGLYHNDTGSAIMSNNTSSRQPRGTSHELSLRTAKK